MVRARTVAGAILTVSLAAALIACGGGSGGGDAQTPQGSGGSSSNDNGTLTTPRSYWELLGAKFVRSGESEQASTQVNAHIQTSVLVQGKLHVATVTGGASTGATGTGADASSNNGASATVTRESAVLIKFTGRTAGTYQVVGNESALTNAGQQARLAFIQASVHEGSVLQKRSTYTATSGSITVTIGTDGKFHISSTTEIPMSKTGRSSDGGLPDSAEQTRMTLRDVH